MAAQTEYDPEQPVVEAIKQGDHSAFNEFLRRQDRWVRGVIFGVLGDRDRVDDVAQQVWTTVWQQVSELRDTHRWRPWVYRLARNTAIDAGRDSTKRKKLTGILTIHPETEKTVETPPQAIQRSEKHQAVLEAISSLPELYREPFTLRHLEGWSYRQIGEALNLPVDTVETRLVRARRLLREALSGKV